MKILITWLSITGLSLGTFLVQQQSRLPSVQQQVQPDTLQREIALDPRGRTIVDFEVAVKGKILIQFEGDRASRVSLTLRGPGSRVPYALKVGSGSVQVEHDMSDTAAAAGTKWSVSIVNLSPGRSAQGTVHISFPSPTETAPGEMVPDQPAQPDQPELWPGGQRFLRFAHYEIVEARGYTESELQQFRSILQDRKRSAAQAKWQTGIRNITQRDQVAGIVIPLLMQRLERAAQASPEARRRPRAPGVQPRDEVGRPRDQPGAQVPGRQPPVRPIKPPQPIRPVRPGQPVRPVQPATPEQLPQQLAQQLPPYEIDVQEHIATMVGAYNDIPASFRIQHLHPRYASLGVNQQVDRRQLGEDLVTAVNPNHRQEIRNALQRSFAANHPKLRWDATRVRPRAQRPPRPQPARRFNASETRQLRAFIRAAQDDPVSGRDPLAKFLLDRQAITPQQLDAQEPNVVEQALANTGVLPFTPDLNSKHTVLDYYNYRIELDWFRCRERDELTPDEPYFHIQSRVPLFDPNDPRHLNSLEHGDLYEVNSHFTASHSGVSDGTERRVRNGRLIFDDTTWNADTSFTITLFEEDFSKQYTTEEIRLQMAVLENELIGYIRDAATDYLQSVVIAEVLDLMPDLPFSGLEQMRVLLNNVIDGLPFGDFVVALESILGSQAGGDNIDPTWVVVHLVLSGGDIGELLLDIGAGNPELGAIILAIQIAGPAAYDFFANLFEGDVAGALEGLIVAPLELLEAVVHSVIRVIDTVIHIVDTVEMILAAIDPDDMIGTQTVTIGASQADIFEDAIWPRPDAHQQGSSEYYWVPAVAAPGLFQQLGFGPTSANSSMLRQGRLHQPRLYFGTPSMGGGGSGSWQGDVDSFQLLRSAPRSSGARYEGYYNVKRSKSGGVETFGFTAWRNNHPEEPRGIFEARRDGKIKVSVCSLNTDELPFVCVADESGNTWWRLASEFEVDAVQGEKYSLHVYNLSLVDSIYGFVTMTEMPPVPPPVVAGYVTRARGEPVSGAQVSIDGGGSDLTNSDGYYQIALPGPNVYQVRVSRATYEPQPAKSVSVIRGTKQVNFYLRKLSDHY